MLPKKIDLRGAESALIMAHNSDGTVTVCADGKSDQILRLVCDSIDIVVSNGRTEETDGDDFPLLLIAGIELYCINHGVALEDLIQTMRSRITLLIPNNKK